MISVVIPVFNEEDNIQPLYTHLHAVLKNLGEYEIIFVDDGSTDATYETIYNLHENDKHVKCIRMQKNFGQTPALLAGLRQAEGNVIVTMDGDLQNDPNDIPALIKKLDSFDVVSGWRFNRMDTAGKRAASKISNRFARWLTNLSIHDFGCTLKAYRKDCLTNLELYGEMHRYIPAVLAWQGYTVDELKVHHHKRMKGGSKYGLSRLIRGFLDLINFRFWSGYSTRPLHLFGGAGLALFATGFFINFYLLMLKVLYNEMLSNRPLLLLGVLLMVMGFQIFMTGFLAEIMIRNYYSGTGKTTYIIREKLL